MKKYLNHDSLSSLTLISLYSDVSLRQALLLLRKKKSRIGARKPVDRERRSLLATSPFRLSGLDRVRERARLATCTLLLQYGPWGRELEISIRLKQGAFSRERKVRQTAWKKNRHGASVYSPASPAEMRRGREARYKGKRECLAATHTFLRLLAKIKCSICSYQFNIWYVGHVLTSILNLFFCGGGSTTNGLPLGALTRRPAIALLAGRGAPQPRQIAISLFGNSSVPWGWSRRIKATGVVLVLLDILCGLWAIVMCSRWACGLEEI